MKSITDLLALALIFSSVIAAPTACPKKETQGAGKYDTYGKYKDAKIPEHYAKYGNYGTYKGEKLPGKYGNYGTYKRDAEAQE